jgi:hypothetical protein
MHANKIIANSGGERSESLKQVLPAVNVMPKAQNLSSACNKGCLCRRGPDTKVELSGMKARPAVQASSKDEGQA